MTHDQFADLRSHGPRCGRRPTRAVDVEDVLVSVFDRFFQSARENRFAQLSDRDDLWQVLLMLTDRTVADQYRRSQAQKRGGGGGGGVALDDVAGTGHDLSELADRDPGPEFVAAFNDHLSRCLSGIRDETTREVALLKLR